ncbi:MAG TPA: glycosyltransferase family 4 protein [Candidatus Barnesiella excrementavium]|nr:glycosyltransferase family 4 protein [Candidatus Barnesiella excrementavium]
MKRLLIDVNPIVPYFVSGKVNGIGRTTLELIQALARVPNLPFEIMLYSQNMKGIGGCNTGLPFKSRHLYLPYRPEVDKLLSRFPVREWFTGYDLMHITHNFEYVHCPERCVLTIHDAMFFSYPESFLGHDFARENYPKLAKKVKAIITCSENSKREIVEYMQIPDEKITVCYWGYNHELFFPREWTPNKYTGNRPYFLSVSCDIGRKNTISVLRAYELLLKQNPQNDLVLVWRNPPIDIKEKYTTSPFAGRIHFVSNVTDEELGRLYSSATAMFFPSKYEGFGLPVLESMASGTPVITCNNSSLREVGGDAALYVEPEDIHSMAHIMEQFENSDLDISAIKKAGIEQASKFSWDTCARQTIEVYKRCLEL